ncbi:MAG: hypothetical protein JNM84_22405 [Planctomycetes bacterium]|nr:hypothetical protein [Planctomycetota bacterium]
MEKFLCTLTVVLGVCYVSSLESGGARPETAPPEAVEIESQEPDPTRSFPTAGGTADSNGRMIAVTGMDLTGQSILYLIDSETQQLAVYQAVGGSRNSRKLYLVGARRIDFDLQLRGYNDESEYSWRDFSSMFERIGAGEDPKAVEKASEREGGDLKLGPPVGKDR